MTIRSLSAGDLQAQLLQTDGGVLLHRLADKKSGRIFLKEDGVLFTLTARKLWDGSLLTVDSAAGWEKVHRDTYHAGKGAPRYALALLWYRMLTGNSVAENAFCDFDEPVTPEQIHTAKACVDAFSPLFTK